MAKVKINYKVRELKLVKSELANLIRAINTYWRTCAYEWAEAVATKIVLDTGMSASSLSPLIRAAGSIGAGQLFIGPNNPPTWYDKEGVQHEDRTHFLLNGTEMDSPRSPELGAKYGEDAFILLQASLAKPVLDFMYYINIFQWSIWESEWKAGEAGDEAFQVALTKVSGIQQVLRKVVV